MAPFIRPYSLKQLLMRMISYVFESVYGTVILNIQKLLEKGSSWFINSVVDQTIDITKHKPLNGGSYLKLPKELNNLFFFNKFFFFFFF